jgi:hypothetical protein
VRITEEQLREWAESDPAIADLLTKQAAISGELKNAELCHMAESFGRPGSMTFSGKRYRAAATEWDYINLLGLLYLLKNGYVSLDDVDLADNPFGER